MGFFAGFTVASTVRFRAAIHELRSLKNKTGSYDETLFKQGFIKGIEKFIYPFWPNRPKRSKQPTQEFRDWLKKEGIKW